MDEVSEEAVEVTETIEAEMSEVTIEDVEDTDDNAIDTEVIESDPNNPRGTPPLHRGDEEGVCWRYLLRFIYRAFGYPSSSDANCFLLFFRCFNCRELYCSG